MNITMIKVAGYSFALSILIISFLFLTTKNVLAADPVGSSVWQNCSGTVADEETFRKMWIVSGCGIADVASVGLAGGPSDCMVDWHRGINSCDLNITSQGKVGSYGNGSMLAFANVSMSKAIDTPPPTNLALYFNNIANESLIFKHADAAVDAPFTSILDIWKVMRNISYGILAVLVLVLSIMITMRKKIDAQTVVTAEAMIPKIIISAVLITFSYAISAVFNQLSAFFGPLSQIAFFFLKGATGTTVGSFPVPATIPGGVGSFAGQCQTTGSINNFQDAIACVFYKLTSPLVLQNVGLGIVLIVIVGIILLIVLIFALLLTYLTRYFKILMLTIFAPLFFTLSVLPGQETKITDWFKDMLSAILAIPAMVFVIFLGILLFLTTDWSVPGSTTGALDPGISTITGVILMFVCWLLALKIPGVIDSAIKGPKKR